MVGSRKENNNPVEDPLQDRRSDYDVTNTVRVSSTTAVRKAVCEIFAGLYPNESTDAVWLAFHDFERFFYGLTTEYFAVDTTYHDIQHTLDMTLAAARLIGGYEKAAPASEQLGSRRALLGVACSLFHDFGYLRHRKRDARVRHGAEFTRSHVSRSGRFLQSYLPIIGLEEFVPVVSRIIHFTGYEVRVEDIALDNELDVMIGRLIGSADLLAQISDRCYLEKCRDRLYPEFVIGDVAVEVDGDTANVRYDNAEDLLSQTLKFYELSAKTRLEQDFEEAYRYLESWFDGRNPYMECIQKNLSFLEKIVADQSWDLLRRNPPCVIPDPDGVTRVKEFARARLQEVQNSSARIQRMSTT